jgi:hypothetical protein
MFLHQRGVPVGSDHKNGGLRTQLLDLRGQGKAVRAGHLVVGNQETESTLFTELKRMFATGDDGNLAIGQTFQPVPKDQRYVLVVLHH